eukprot:GSMAST32.ASY1.ANO1.2720.1 assembled CDS
MRKPACFRLLQKCIRFHLFFRRDPHRKLFHPRSNWRSHCIYSFEHVSYNRVVMSISSRQMTSVSTDPSAQKVHGGDPQNLIEKILRFRIYENVYWKEHCFALTAETVVDKAMELEFVGGSYSANVKPTPFMCLLLKMLQIQPELEIVREFVKNDENKYVRVLGALYLRLTGKILDIYKYLEPLYNDYRNLRVRTMTGWEVTTVDQFIEQMLTENVSCEIGLPHLPQRHLLVDQGVLEPYKSIVEPDSDDETDEDSEKKKEKRAAKKLKKAIKKAEKKEKKRTRKGLVPRDVKTSTNNKNSALSQKQGVIKDSVEYWNLEREKLGLKPLRR